MRVIKKLIFLCTIVLLSTTWFSVEAKLNLGGSGRHFLSRGSIVRRFQNDKKCSSSFLLSSASSSSDDMNDGIRNAVWSSLADEIQTNDEDKKDDYSLVSLTSSRKGQRLSRDNIRAQKIMKKARKVEKTSLQSAVRPLLFWESMVCGAVSRSIAQTVMHPANTMKTMLQSRSSSGGGIGAQFGLAEGQKLNLGVLIRPKNLKILTRGAGAQFVLSVPHGAVNFAVLECVRGYMGRIFENSRYVAGFGLDFLSSCVATLCCSLISTPQMVSLS